MHQQTTLHDLVQRIRLAKPFGTVYMGMYRSKGYVAVPQGQDIIYGFLGRLGYDFIVIQTRYDSVGDLRVPRELIYFCLALAENRETAAPYLYQIASAVHSMCQLSANAGSSVVQETLFTEFRFARWHRFTRKIPYTDIPQYPLGGRFLDKMNTMRLATRIWGHPQRDRLLLAISQYEEALRHWRPGSAPLLCLYLWMAVEALTEAVLQKLLQSKNLTEQALMDEWDIPHDQHSKCKACGASHAEVTICGNCGHSQPPTKNDRKYHLLARVRREQIFNGDKETYNAVRRLSNGIEHGSAAFQDIWALPFDVYEKTAAYVRGTIFRIIDLEAESCDLLDAPPYVSVYLPPDPPVKQGYSNDRPSLPFDITTKKHDWYALDFQPQPQKIEFDFSGREFRIEYATE